MIAKRSRCWKRVERLRRVDEWILAAGLVKAPVSLTLDPPLQGETTRNRCALCTPELERRHSCRRVLERGDKSATLPVYGQGRSTGNERFRRFIKTLSFSLACSLSLLPGFDASAETIILSGATVHTVSGGTLQPGYVVIRDDQIISVGTNAPGTPGRMIDLTGLHLYPGMIDADTVLGLNEIGAVRASVDDREVGAYTPEVSAWVSINPDSELIPVARVNGITHVNAMPSGGVVAGQSSLIRLAGWTIEDLAEEKQTGLNVYWPSMQLNTSPDNKKSLKEQDRDRKTALRELDRFFDEATAYAKARAAGSASVNVVPAWEAMLPYVRGEQPVFIHAEEIRQLRAALKWINERKLKAAIFGGRDAWQIARELATANVPVVYDAVHELPEDELNGYDAQFKAPALLTEAGVKVAISLGPEMEESRARNLPYAAAQALAYGLPADAALKSVTLYPAQILGVADRLGSIESGKEASLFATDGDILDIRSNVKHLWIAGKEVSLETRHTRLYEKYRNRPRR